jgi:hypothetical protein
VSGHGWAGFRQWSDLDGVRVRLAAGADPGTVLHEAVRWGTPEVVAELAGRAADVDAEVNGHSALWIAVFTGQEENAFALLDAGADPWRPMMKGWSPGRLTLTGPDANMFDVPADEPDLSAADIAAIEESAHLIEVLKEVERDGMSLACVAGITAAEAARRLDATAVTDTGPDSVIAKTWDYDPDGDEVRYTVGVTDVPGGCVVVQPWGYTPSTPRVAAFLSAGTRCYAMYANPKSGDQGSITRDGVRKAWDLTPGADPDLDGSTHEILISYLYQDAPLAYAFAYAGLRPADSRALDGPPDTWLRLPTRDYWH